MYAFAAAKPLTRGIAHGASPARRFTGPRGYRCRVAADLSRRSLLRHAATLVTGAALMPSRSAGNTLFWPRANDTGKVTSAGTTVFAVVPTSISNVNLQPVGIEEAVDDAARCMAVFLGEHHNSLVDHALQARIIGELRKRQDLVVGLEMIQQRYQPVLDRYIAGEIGELDLYLDTEWETRWVWPYEVYLPVLRICREHRIPLLALSMDSETLFKLRSEGGISNLSLDEFRAHIGNPSVFAEISKDPAFKAYISECITPSYASHYRMGLLNETANFNSFYTARVLRDEAMATRTVRAIWDNPDTTIVCLLGSDHVKFEYGVKARVERQLQALAAQRSEDAMLSKTDSEPSPAMQTLSYSSRLRTVMLNPGPADAFDPRDRSLKLEMAVRDNPIPIADYLWFSSPADAKPRRQVKSRLLPPVERLTSL